MNQDIHCGLFRNIILRTGFIIMIFCLFLGSDMFFCARPSEGAKAKLTEIQAVKVHETVILDATLEGAFNRDIIEAVSSGAPTRFRFMIRLMKNRGLWFDKKVKEFDVHHTVMYDVLKKQYVATRSYSQGVEENLTTSDWDEMVQWMSELKAVHFSTPELKDPKAEYYLRIRAEMKCIKIPFPLNYLLAFVALWNFDTPWVRVPVDIDTEKSERIEQALIQDGKGP